TNLEAAEEVARQLRLRDLAGLIVIDFIDMEENRNNRAVEKKLKDCLKNDRARIQVGRISHFGLLEMSRQRIRSSVLESTMQPCPHCGGTGHVRSESSVALLVIRAVEEYLLEDARNDNTVRTPSSTALSVLHHKRWTLVALEQQYGVKSTVEADETVGSQHYVIEKGPPSASSGTIEHKPVQTDSEFDEEENDADLEKAVADEETHGAGEDQEEARERKKRRRRRRRGGRDRDKANGEQPHVETAVSDSEWSGLQEGEDHAEDRGADDLQIASEQEGHERKKRRRGKRGGRRQRHEGDAAASETPGPTPVETADGSVLDEATAAQP